MDIDGLGIEPVLDDEGNRMRVSVETGSDTIHAIAWLVKVNSNISLYLLDAQVEDNTPDTRRLTARLYGDHYMRDSPRVVAGCGRHAIASCPEHSDFRHSPQ